MKSGIFDKNGVEVKVGDKLKNVLTFYFQRGNSADWFGTEPQVSYSVFDAYFEYVNGEVFFKNGSYAIRFKNGEEIYFHELIDFELDDALVLGLDRNEFFDFFADFVFGDKDTTFSEEEKESIELAFEKVDECKKKLRKYRNEGKYDEEVESEEWVYVDNLHRQWLALTETMARQMAKNFEVVPIQK